MLSFRKIFSVCTLLALCGCGFQPLYQKQSASDAVVDDLAQIEVIALTEREDNIERLGHKMKNLLLDRLNPNGRPATPFYTLEITIRTNKTELGLRVTEEATRAKLAVNADYVLSERKTKAILFRDKARSVNSYNIVNSDFATLSAENNAKDRGAREVADDIKLRLGIFFARLRSGS